MCGRYVLSRAAGDLLSYFDAKETEGAAPPPSWNVAPTDVPIITEAAVKRRALVPAEGYYEWEKTEDGRKIPNYLCAVLTTTAHDSLGHVHDRAPAIVPGDRYADWLDPGTTDKEDMQKLFDAIPEPVLTPRMVTDRVNSVRNNGPELIEPA